MVAQAKLETGNYTSNIFVNSNNLFGMKRAFTREHTQTGEYRGHAAYSSWCESCLDRILWDLHHFAEKPNYDDYLSFLSNYAEDEQYINKLERIARTLK